MPRVGRGLVPTGDTIYQDGDLIYVACMTDRTDEIETLLREPAREALTQPTHDTRTTQCGFPSPEPGTSGARSLAS